TPDDATCTLLESRFSVAADALEQSVLESKDRDQLVAIASALGVKVTSRAKKADVILKILEQTGALPSPAATPAPSAEPPTSAPEPEAAAPNDFDVPLVGEDGEPLSDWEIELIRQGISTDTSPVAEHPGGAGRGPSNASGSGGANRSSGASAP